MDVRIFESYNLQDAIKLIKSELGKDAVIISTREKEIYSKEAGKNCKIYEVAAAPNISEGSKVIPAKIGELLPKIEFPKVKSKSPAIIVKDNRRQVKDKLLSPDNINTTIDKENTKQALSLNDLHSDIVRIRKEIGLLPQLDIIEQVQEIKVLLHDIMLEKYKKNSESDNIHITNIGIQLRVAGVSESLISHISTYLASLEEPKKNEDLIHSPEKIKDYYLNSSIKFIFKYLKITGNFSHESNNKQRIIALIGPTGVGKTTTIAKIAARIKIIEKKQVNLISMDSFRVAASDQLRVYAKILECPFWELTESNDLINIISKQRDADYIFIDTAGRSPKSPEQLNLIRKLTELPIPIEFHLVLSSGMKQRDIDEIIKSFKFLIPSSLIFTKLDESWAYGEILNAAIQSKIPLSYFTTGQRVPEDLEIASKERVVERIFKL